MAHFALLDGNNIVMNVVVVNNNDIIDNNGNESEEMGIKLLQSLHPGTRWVQTSYNSNIRGSYAGIGDYYNEEYDVFCAPKPFPSWTFDPEMCKWNPPVECDIIIDEGVIVEWNESELKWDKTVVPKPEWPEEMLNGFEDFWTGAEWILRPKQIDEPAVVDEPTVTE